MSDEMGPDTPDTPEPEQPERPRGSMSFQDADTTTPREPTLAEQRARRAAIKRQEQDERRAVVEADEKKSRTRRRVLIGGGVTVGLAALIGTSYSALSPDEVTATCTDENGVVVSDDHCDRNSALNRGARYDDYSYGHGGSFIFIGGHSYGYNYGGTGGIGQRVSGGSTVRPSGSTIKTTSGSTIQRGGFGIKGSGKSGGS